MIKDRVIAVAILAAAGISTAASAANPTPCPSKPLSARVKCLEAVAISLQEQLTTLTKRVDGKVDASALDARLSGVKIQWTPEWTPGRPLSLYGINENEAPKFLFNDDQKRIRFDIRK